MRADDRCIATASGAEEEEELRQDGLAKRGVRPWIGNDLIWLGKEQKDLHESVLNP